LTRLNLRTVRSRSSTAIVPRQVSLAKVEFKCTEYGRGWPTLFS